MSTAWPDGPLKVFIGYDAREDIAWRVCRFSLLRHATCPLEVQALRQDCLRKRGLYWRDKDQASTQFSLTRFLTPHLGGSFGLSLFVDCDFLFTADIACLVAQADPAKAVHVVQHDYVPSMVTKMDGRPQAAYPRKNWSSFMLFNNAKTCCRDLTPDIVNSQSPSFLHRFNWVSDEALIGKLPQSWNFLVGEYEMPAEVPSAIHYTNGGPWFDQCRDVDYAALWLEEEQLYRRSVQHGS